MKIGMLTWGSHGDVRPFLALAEALQAAGHQVSLTICGIDGTDYGTLSSSSGVRITALNALVLTPEQVQQIAQTVYTTRNPITQMKTFLRLGYDPVEAALFEAAEVLAADSDLLIGHYFIHPLQTAAAVAGRPYVSVVLSHAGIPTAFDHPNGSRAIGKAGHRLLWWLTGVLLNGVLRPYPNRYRKRLGLPPIGDVLTEAWITAPLTLLAISPHICSPRPDWPAAVRACGFFDMPTFELEGEVPAELQAFLEAGAAPVYMTFGSWMPKDLDHQRTTLALLAEAATISGCRAIIQAPSWEACGLRSSNQILYVAAAPHAAIFPHCSAIVHHGGAGTTQAATGAGKPSIVVAHLSEQEYWGRELRRIGVAGKTLKRRSLTDKALAQAIRLVQSQPKMHVHAQATAAAMGRENGVATAVALIEATFGGLMTQPEAA